MVSLNAQTDVTQLGDGRTATQRIEVRFETILPAFVARRTLLVGHEDDANSCCCTQGPQLGHDDIDCCAFGAIVYARDYDAEVVDDDPAGAAFLR